MSFQTIKFHTDWECFSLEERKKILDAQIELRREYERKANPDYFRNTMANYISGRIK
jgi:hypothetical protein